MSLERTVVIALDIDAQVAISEMRQCPRESGDDPISALAAEVGRDARLVKRLEN
ncbi:MAG: hypothetical protein LBH13_10690 [Cellulomonadaceae bacterium]|jgi:hypothetical protein|nr:hypothetical protein [Cellulomonadaceae bacterium]